MDEVSKRAFDAYFAMYERAWAQFNERRQFEVQIGRTFWAGLAAAIAGSITLPTLPQIPGGRATLIAISLLPLLLHSVWCWGIGRAQRADRLIAVHWEREIQALINAPFDEDLQDYLDSLKITMGLLKNWTYRFQLGVTAFLCMVLIAINWSRFEARDAAQRRELETKQLQLEIQKLELEVKALRTQAGNS